MPRLIRRTTDRPSYEGRPLPRPEEEVADQGLAFDLGTLSRRQLFRGLGLGAGAVVLAACGTDSSSSSAASSTTTSTSTSTSTAATSEIPDETAGPYPGDGSNGPDVLEQSGVVRSDLRSSFGSATGRATGVPLTLTMTLTNVQAKTPYAGAAVYVWHADAQGRYSMYSDGVTEENYLRGVQVADESGQVTFTTIVPGCYDGRWPHIHFEVYPDQSSITDAANAVATSQIAIPEATASQVYATSDYSGSTENLSRVSLSSDNVFGDDSAVLQLPTVTGSVSGGLTMTMPVAIDPSTTPPAGGGQAPPASR